MFEAATADLSEEERDRIIKTAVSPRPIAWVSTVDEDGVNNLAPFSSYNYVGSRNPVVVFNSRRRSDGSLKDTARNILDTEEFAVNVVTVDQVEEMDHTSKSIPPEESEFDLAGIEGVECAQIDPLRVARAPVAFECTLYDSIEIYNRVMVIGEVEHFHIADSVLNDGKIDSRKLDTVGRLGGPFYTVSDPYEFERQY